MPSKSYLERMDIFQTLRIDELVQGNEKLAIKLQASEAETSRLKLAIERLEYNHQVLTEKLAEANNEIGRLSMVLKRQVNDMEIIKPGIRKAIPSNRSE